MLPRMLALAVAGVIEHRRRRGRSPEGPVIADIDPTSANVSLARGQHRHGRVVTMQALGRQNVSFEQPAQRRQRRANRSHGVGHRREADRNTLARTTLGLAVERLMLPKFLEQDHRQQARPRPATGNDMEWGRRLTDLLAVPAGEFLPHRLDHLPLAGDRFQGFGHILTHLAQPDAAATRTGRRRCDHHTLTREMFGEGIAFGTLTDEPRDRRDLGYGNFRGELILGGTGRKLLERERHLLDKQGRPLRPRPINLTFQLGDPQLLMRDQGQIFRRLRARHRELGGDLLHPGALAQQRRFQHLNVVRQGSRIGIHAHDRITDFACRHLQNHTARHYPARAGRQVWRGLRQSIPSSI